MKLRGIRGLNPVGLAVFVALLLVTVLGQSIAPYDPWERFEPYRRPDRTHWLGTNDLGNDIFSELIVGTRVTLLVGLAAATLATTLGLGVGLVAGYFRGAAEEILMGITDLILVIPRIPLAIIVGAFLNPGYGLMALTLGLLWWTSTARVIRARTLQVREMAFVTGQRTLGFTHARILFTDILPNVLSVLGPKFMLTVASAMITEASLSFLGLGDPAVKSWGTMIRFAFEKGGFLRNLWWWYAAPGLAITLSVLSLVLMGFSLSREQPLAAGVPV